MGRCGFLDGSGFLRRSGLFSRSFERAAFEHGDAGFDIGLADGRAQGAEFALSGGQRRFGSGDVTTALLCGSYGSLCVAVSLDGARQSGGSSLGDRNGSGTALREKRRDRSAKHEHGGTGQEHLLEIHWGISLAPRQK